MEKAVHISPDGAAKAHSAQTVWDQPSFPLYFLSPGGCQQLDRRTALYRIPIIKDGSALIAGLGYLRNCWRKMKKEAFLRCLFFN